MSDRGFDPFSPDVLRDPYGWYDWLRDHDPIHWSESLNAWVVTRYADVVDLFNRPETFASDRFRTRLFTTSTATSSGGCAPSKSR